MVKDGIDAGSFTEPSQATVGNKLVNRADDVQTKGAPLEFAVSLQPTALVVCNLYLMRVRVPLRPLLRCNDMLPDR